MSIDINLIRTDKGGDPQKVIDSQNKRYRKPEIVQELIELDKAWRAGKNQTFDFIRKI